MQNAKTGLAGFGTALGSGIGQLVGITSVAAAAGLAIKAFKISLDEAAQSETSLARLDATVQSTGRSADISADSLRRLAEGMQGMFGNEDIEAAANALMRYSEVATTDIPKILNVARDYAAAMGISMAEAADSIGRAMETGMTRAFGFSIALRKQITDLMGVGESAKAGELILNSLSTKYAGQYTAAANTYDGSIKTLKTSMGEFWEAIGQGLVGPGRDFNVWLTNNIDTITQSVEAENRNTAAVEEAYKALGIESNVLTHNTFYWAVYGDRLQEVTNQIKMGQLATEHWSAWLAGQPEKIVAVGGAIDSIIPSFDKIANSWQEVGWQALLAHAAFDGAITYEEMQALVNYGIQLGILTQQEATAKLEAYNLTAALNSIPKDTDITLTMWYIQQNKGIAPGPPNMPTDISGAGGGPGAGWDYKGGAGYGTYGGVVKHWFNPETGQYKASGGSFIVPPGFPNDSYPLHVQSGEHVSVMPAGGAVMGNADILQELRQLRNYLPRAIRDAMQTVI